METMKMGMWLMRISCRCCWIAQGTMSMLTFARCTLGGIITHKGRLQTLLL